MAEEKKEEKKEEKIEITKLKFKQTVPIVATAKKVGEVGDEQILQIEVPYQDDVTVLEKAVKAEKEKMKGVKKEKEVDKDMEAEEIKRIVDEKLGEMEYQKTIKRIAEKTSEIGKKVSETDGKVLELVTAFKDYFEGSSKKQDEACSGVECLKVDFSKNKKEVDEKIADVRSVLEKLDKRTRTVVCSGGEGCNAEIPVGSTFCPNCGKHIDEWKGLPNWTPYDKRKK